MIIRKWITKSIVDQIKMPPQSLEGMFDQLHTYLAKLAMFCYFPVITEGGLTWTVWLGADHFGKIEQEKREKNLLLKRVI